MTRGPLRIYWIKPSIDALWVSQDPWDHWGKTGRTFNFGSYKEINPKICLLSKGEMANTFVKVWLYTGANSSILVSNNEEARDKWAFWVNPLWLKELPV